MQIASRGWSYLEPRRPALCSLCSWTSAEVWGGEGTQPPLAKALPLHHPPDQPPCGGSPWRLPLALGNSLEWEPILLSGSQFSIQETTSILLNLTNTCSRRELQGQQHCPLQAFCSITNLVHFLFCGHFYP